MKTLAEAFHHTLKDIYYAENALTKAMPKMIDAVADGDIKTAFQDHLKETKEQVTRSSRRCSRPSKSPPRARSAMPSRD